MDFRQTPQPVSGRPTTPPVAPTPSEHKHEKESVANSKNNDKWGRLMTGVLLIGIAILLAGIALVFTRGHGDTESKYVTTGKYQAVFLNNGQVYFGNINSLTNDYIHLTHVYYLTQAGDSTSSNYSLVKLGCQQIHDPSDEMLINRSQVTFWENLQDKGKVVTSINQFKKQNPNGPDCTQVSNQTQAAGSSTQSSQNSSTTGTGTSTTDTSKTTPTK